jgi:hypothetical protein
MTTQQTALEPVQVNGSVADSRWRNGVGIAAWRWRDGIAVAEWRWRERGDSLIRE